LARALKRCLTNLIDNALKFGTRATIRVADGEALIIGVADEEPGDIAQAHGGKLTLSNRPEGGLVAELRLPRE
jgi:signal transduction histidine kinase